MKDESGASETERGRGKKEDGAVDLGSFSLVLGQAGCETFLTLCWRFINQRQVKTSQSFQAEFEGGCLGRREGRQRTMLLSAIDQTLRVK